MAELRKHASTRSLIAADRDNHRLGLQAIELLPKEFTKEVLMGTCRALKVHPRRVIISLPTTPPPFFFV